MSLFQEVSPDWYKTPLPGPAAYKKGRLPGCNGMVCYCNCADYCNTSLDYCNSSKDHPVHYGWIVLGLFIREILLFA